jgi:lysozyme
MKLSPAGVEALKQYEGLSLTAYRDSGGVWTIGYGSTRDVREGMRISQAEADQRFLADTEWAQAAVRTDVVVPITQPQFDALVSLAYNIGAGAFAKSTLVRLLNAGDYRGAAEQFLAWNKVRGEVVTGLAARRAKERAMFMEPAPIAESKPSLEIPMPDSPAPSTLQTVATVAGAATGNPWIGPALGILSGLWPELKALFAGPGASEVAQRNARAAEAVMGAVMQATGTESPPDAVKAVQADPVMAQQARAAAADALDAFGLVEAGAGGIEGARKFAAATDMPPFWCTGAFAMTVMIMPLIYWVVYVVTRDGSPFGADIRAAVVTAIVTGALGSFLGYWVGQTFKRQQARGQ